MEILTHLDRIKARTTDLGGPVDWLNPPASEQSIASVEAEIGYKLPPAWRALYLAHDGERESLGLFLGLPWLPLPEVLAQWRNWKSLEEEYCLEGTHFSIPPGAIKERYINMGWIPISHDWGGNHLGVDMTPGPDGRVGQIINFGRDEEMKYVVALTAEELFRFLADEICSDRCQLEDPSEPLMWRDGLSFLDALKELPLPLYHAPPPVPRPQGDLAAWRASYSEPWQKAIGDPEAFLRSRRLYLIRKDLRDLLPLAWCRDLLGLYIARNEVTDLTPLSRLPYLKLLHAVGNPIVDLQGLSSAPNLRELRLDETGVKDLSPLARVISLEELYLTDTPVTDLTSLGHLPNLRHISLPAGAVNLQPLATTPALESLSLNEGAEATLSDLALLTRLEELEIRPASNARLDAIGECAGLRRLKLIGARGQAMTFLSQLRELELLELDDCELPDLSGLHNHPTLRRFTSRESTVGDLSGLASCSQLRTVQGSYAQFHYLHDKVARHVSFPSISGRMTDEESSEWMRLLKERG